MPDHDTSEMERRLKEVERRLAALTQDLSAVKHKAGAASQARPPGGGGVSLFHGKTTTSITARAGEVQGSGTVEGWYGPGTLADIGQSVSVSNWTGSTIASGIRVIIAYLDGEWIFISADCSGAA